MMTPAGDPNDLEILLEANDQIPNSPTGEGDDLGGDSNESANPSNGASAGGSNESSASLRFPSPPIDVSVQVIPDDNTNKGTAVLATALASAPIAPAPSADMGTHGKSPLPDKQTPTMSAHIIRVKHTRPGLAIQAVGEPWESLAEHGPQQRATAAATAPTSDRSPRSVKRLQ